LKRKNSITEVKMKMNQKRKKTLVIISITLLMLNFMVISQINDAKTNSTKNIAVVMICCNDGWNRLALDGLLRAQADFDINLDMTLPSNQSEQDAAIERYATDVTTTWDLIIALDFQAIDSVNTSAINHPNQRFSLIDNIINPLAQPNVSSITFKSHEGSFLAGALASTLTNTKTIGFMGGFNISNIQQFESGYAQGAKWINPDITVITDFVNSWVDRTGGKTITEQLIASGADIIYTAAGYSGFGTFDAVELARGQNQNVYAIGVDYNQDKEAPGVILTSMMKRHDTAVYNEIQAIIQQTWTGGTKVLGLAEDGVGITGMAHVLPIRDSSCTSTHTRFELVQDLKQAIINGTIMVNSTLMQPSEFNTVPHPCTYEAPTIPHTITTTFTQMATTTESTIINQPTTETVDLTETVTTTSEVVVSTTTTELKSTEGFSIIFAISGLALSTFVIQYERKRKGNRKQ
jgi:basic membrane protein A